VTVARFQDGSLVVPARVSTNDGKMGAGIARIRRGHPQYEAWRSYCERHPEDVVERREQHVRVRASESVETGLVWAVTCTAFSFVFSAFAGELDEIGLGIAVAVGVVIFSFWFTVGFVGSLWSADRDQRPSTSRVEVEPPPVNER
jgi:hypothetical protein